MAKGIQLIEGKFNKAFVFYDHQGTVVTKEPIKLAQGDYTISLWFKTLKENNEHYLFAATLLDKHGITLSLKKNQLQFKHRSMEGGGKKQVNYTINEPQNEKLQRTGQKIIHRNGIVEPVFVEFKGQEAVYRID